MHPALSVIFFTAISGCGYGLLFLLGLGLAVNPQIFGRIDALLLLATGAVFAAAGLTSSLFHLGQPQRAWRALSQWRSSWLSREGVAAIATYIPIAALGFAWVFGESVSGQFTVGAVLSVPCALITVW